MNSRLKKSVMAPRDGHRRKNLTLNAITISIIATILINKIIQASKASIHKRFESVFKPVSLRPVPTTVILLRD